MNISPLPRALRRRMLHSLVVALLLFGAGRGPAADAAGTKPIAFSRLKRSSTVDFEREILPILKNNCIACHNQTKPKGGLVLETPQAMLKGGDAGPAIVANKPAESLLLKAAAHQDPELIMPPPENKVAASDLKPNELGLLQLWIEQGAKGEVRAVLPLNWQPLPPGLKSIYAVALTRDGQFAAGGRGNEIFVYELPTKRLAARLNDPQLHAATGRPGAHRDLVNALAFSPDGEWIASGGYREVKLWRREPAALKFKLPDRTQILAASPNGKWLAAVSSSGSVRILDAKGKQAGIVRGAPVSAVRFLPGSDRLVLARGAALELLAIPPSIVATTTLSRAVTSLAFLSNRIAVATGDNAIRILAQSNTTLVATGQLEAPSAIALIDSAVGTGDRLVAGGPDGRVYDWDAARGRFTVIARHEAALTALAVRPDGSFVASAAGSDARLWQFGKSNAVATLRGDRRSRFQAEELEREATFAQAEIVFRKAGLKAAETAQTNALARHTKAESTNTALVKVFEEKQLALTNAVAAQHQAERALDDLGPEVKALLDALFAAETESTNAAALAKAAKERPDKAKAEKLAANAEAKAKQLEEAKANLDKLPAETKGRQKNALDKLRETRKGVTDAEKVFRRAELARSTSENELELATAALRKADKAVADARAALTASESDAVAAESRSQAAQKSLAAGGPVAAIAFSADNGALITASDRWIQLWNPETGEPLAAVPSTSSPGSAAALNATTFTAGGNMLDVTPRWKMERQIGTGDDRSPLADRINALRFTSDGTQLLTGGGEPTRGGEIKLWRVRDGALVRDLSNVHSDSVFALDLSRDGKLLASGAADRFAKVVELASGKVLKTLEGHTHHVLGVSWKRDGRTLVTAGADNVAKVWDATTGERRKNLDGFGKEVTAVAFVGVSDEAVLSAGDGQVVRVKEKGEKVRSFTGARDYVYATEVTPDGRIIVAGGADGVLRAWNGADGKLLAEFPTP